jgi:type IV pilus assembly protein PilB
VVVRNTSSLKKKLGDILVEVGIITQDQLNQAVELQRARGGKLGDILKELNFCGEDVLLAFLGRQCGVSYISLAEYGDIPPDVINLVPENVARLQTLIPIAKEENTLTIAMSDPLNVFATDDLKLMTGCEIKVVIASDHEIKQAINKHYSLRPQPSAPAAKENPNEPSRTGNEVPTTMHEIMSGIEPAAVPARPAQAQAEVFSVSVEANDAPVVKIANVLLANAVKAAASDIHIEPYENSLRVRYRLDGVLHSQPAPPRQYQNALVSRIKVMAQMDVAEHRLPQDGRIKIKIEGKEVDIRVSSMPTPHGEKVVLRLLDASTLKVDLADLGFDPPVLASYRKILQSPLGMVLVTGPTGSGKTTTLYASLSALNRPDRNIVTIEDPVEYKIEGVNQVQARPEIGLTFAAGMRAFLRQDPDVIMVGEIRDPETAEIAVNAALTGHLVLSTLHTNDASGAVTRLINMGLEPYLVASTLVLTVAQRLLRVVCSRCKKTENVPLEDLTAAGIRPSQLKAAAKAKHLALPRGEGCEACAQTGYRGRIAIYEILPQQDAVRQLIVERANAHAIKRAARRAGMTTLREAALQKMFAGITTLEEVLRVTQTDSDDEE